MAEIQQLNLPAIFAAAQAIKQQQANLDLTRAEMEELGRKRQSAIRAQSLAGSAARGDMGAGAELAGLDPERANAATTFFKKNILPKVLSEAESVRDSDDFASAYSEFTGKLKKAQLIDPNDPPPDQPDPAFIQRFIAEGEALLGKKEGEGFTLGPDQGRYDAEGNLIARGPSKTEKPEKIENVSAITLRNLKTQETFTLDRKDPRLAEFLQPGSGYVEVPLSVSAKDAEGISPSGNRIDEITADLSVMNRARGRLATIKQSIVENRSRAGVGGSLSKFVQRGVGIAVDLAELGIDVPGFNKEVVDEVATDLNTGKAEEGIGVLFDRDIPRNEVFQNGLAYTLAKARKGPGRLNTDDVKRALPDVQVTGLKSVDEILARLEAVDQEFADAAADLTARLGKNSTGGPPVWEMDEDGNLVRTD